MRTYKNLQDAVLQWMADEGDTGLLRTLVKDAINRAHQNLLNDDRYDFMLWARNETLNVTADTKIYTLHPKFGHPLFFYNPTTNTYMEEISPRGLLESGAQWNEGESTEPDTFMLTGLSKVLTQPTVPGVIRLTTTGGTESAVNSILVRGMYEGVEVSETLTSGSAWSSIVGTQMFDVVEDITKIGATWLRTVSVKSGTDTLMIVSADCFGRQYRTFELLENPTAPSTITYRFYRQPRQLVLDNDIPDLPKGFDDILVYQALVAMHGYTRATEAELTVWSSQIRRLTDVLQQTYRSTRTMGGRPTYTRFIPRF